MMTGSLKKKKIKKKKLKGGGPLIRACSLIRSNTVLVRNMIKVRMLLHTYDTRRY